VCPLEYEPPAWHIPWLLMPWLPSLCLLLVLFFLGNIPSDDYIRFGVWCGKRQWPPGCRMDFCLHDALQHLLYDLLVFSTNRCSQMRLCGSAGILAAFYLLFSLPMSYIKHYRRDWKNTEELK
jgi:hypothetical protein